MQLITPSFMASLSSIYPKIGQKHYPNALQHFILFDILSHYFLLTPMVAAKTLALEIQEMLMNK